MTETFTGRVVRVGAVSDVDPSAVFESFFLSVDEPRSSIERFLAHLYRKVAAWWIVDVWEFTDAPKRYPALVYERRIDTTVSAAEFQREYFAAVDATSAPRSGSFDPSPRGDPEARQRELSMLQRVFSMDEDDPWVDVRFAFEHWCSRVLFSVPDGFLETIWFSSTAYEEDPKAALEQAWADFGRSRGGTLVAVAGPTEANEMARPASGLRVGRARRALAGGAAEYVRRFVTLEAWQGGAHP